MPSLMEGDERPDTGMAVVTKSVGRLFPGPTVYRKPLAPKGPWFAASLSFLVPGLGEIYAGRWRRGLVGLLATVVLCLVSFPVGFAPLYLLLIGGLASSPGPPPFEFVFVPWAAQALGPVAALAFFLGIPVGFYVWISSTIAGYSGALAFNETHPPKECPRCGARSAWNARMCPRCAEPFPDVTGRPLFLQT